MTKSDITEIQEEADIAGGNEEKNDDQLVIEIREIVNRPEIESSKECRIYRVPKRLRKWKEEAYTPQVVSIGPFHHKNERLKAMEGHKERYLRSFLQRSKINSEYLVSEIRAIEGNIRGCYEEIVDLTSDGFVKMILLDAIFILELFIRVRQASDRVSSCQASDPNVVYPWHADIMEDLLLLENQLPFFVIKKLYDLANLSLPGGLLQLSLDYFKYLNMQRIVANPDVKIEHFTDLIRTFHLPPLAKQPIRSNELVKHLYPATRLHEAGVKFEVVKSECDFDIKFEGGVLKIPSRGLEDCTEVVTRNIMALEQTRYIENAYFTDYFIFMDLLINTKEDVDLLCGKQIFVNYLGDNNAATVMINDLNKGIIWRTVRDDYLKLCEELNKFYESPWHRMKATLKGEYFSTPWRTASTFAAIILLLLTFVQTIFSTFPAFKAK